MHTLEISQREARKRQKKIQSTGNDWDGKLETGQFNIYILPD